MRLVAHGGVGGVVVEVGMVVAILRCFSPYGYESAEPAGEERRTP